MRVVAEIVRQITFGELQLSLKSPCTIKKPACNAGGVVLFFTLFLTRLLLLLAIHGNSMAATRSFLQLRVGKTHTVEVLIHVRRRDAAWFAGGNDARQGLLDMLSRRIIPREFGDDIERYHEKRNPQAQQKPVEVGEKNKPKKGAGVKRKRKRKDEPQGPSEKPRRDVTHAYNDKVRVTYRLQEIKPYESATLTMSSSDADDLAFRQLPKLSKRIELWCFPANETGPMEPDPDDGGFPRPELIPISSLFRPPQESRDTG